LVWGDHYAAADTAAFLASIGKKVTIVTENDQFGSTIEPVHMYVLRKRFNQTDAEALSSKPFRYPVKVLANSTVNYVDGKTAVIEKSNFSKQELEVDDVVACHRRPNTELYKKLKSDGLRVVNVGDSVQVRNLHAAIKEGAGFGLTIDGNQMYNGNGFVDELSLEVQNQF
jgi:thioredoxin reductase